MSVIAFKNDFRRGNLLAQKAMAIVERVYNTAALYKGTTFRGQDDDYVNYNNKMTG